MKRISLECAHCHGNDFEVSYGSGSTDGSWQVEIACNGCGHITLLAVTRQYVPALDCVNDQRDFYEPTKKVKEA